MHYAFDLWMGREFPKAPWCRYADDGLVHCRTEQEAQAIKAALAARLNECGLEMHPDKTRIVYCKDGSRKGQYSDTKFEYLGYTYRARVVKNHKRNTLFVSFTPAVSPKALTDWLQQPLITRPHAGAMAFFCQHQLSGSSIPYPSHQKQVHPANEYLCVWRW
jgi:hypothetical protein